MAASLSPYWVELGERVAVLPRWFVGRTVVRRPGQRESELAQGGMLLARAVFLLQSRLSAWLADSSAVRAPGELTMTPAVLAVPSCLIVSSSLKNTGEGHLYSHPLESPAQTGNMGLRSGLTNGWSHLHSHCFPAWVFSSLLFEAKPRML